MEIKLGKQLIAEKMIPPSELKDHPKSIEIYGINENIDDLIKSMQENGFISEFSIIVNQDYKIISGHRRKSAAIKINLTEVPVKIYQYSDELEELIDLLNANLYRLKTNLSVVREGKLREDIYNEIGKRNMIVASHPNKEIYDVALSQNDKATSEKTQVSFVPIKARKQAAVDAKMSDGTYYQGKVILQTIDDLKSKGEIAAAKTLEVIAEKGKTYRSAYEIIKESEKHTSSTIKPKNTEELLTKNSTIEMEKLIEILKNTQVIKVTNNEKTSGREAVKVVQEILQKEKRENEILEIKKEIENIQVIPEKFDIVVIDPPWPYGGNYDPNARRIASPYPEMSLEEISNIEIPATENSIVWLWTTHKFMRESFKLLDKWGFQDKMILTWVKNRMGMGTWLRSKSEFCIMAIRGHPKINLTNQTTVLIADVQEHSRKPDEFYKMVDSLCIGTKIDYFSREKRLGWYQYGVESNKFWINIRIYFWRKCENLIIDLFKKLGYYVFLKRDFNKEGAPKYYNNDNSIISPDIEIIKNGRRFFIEVKGKALRKKYSDTGIDIRHYNHYKKLQEESGDSIFIIFVDPGYSYGSPAYDPTTKNTIYGNFLDKLSIKINSYPKIEDYGRTGPIIYFPYPQNFIKIGKFNTKYNFENKLELYIDNYESFKDIITDIFK